MLLRILSQKFLVNSLCLAFPPFIDIIFLPAFNRQVARKEQSLLEKTELPDEVVHQMHDYVSSTFEYGRLEEVRLLLVCITLTLCLVFSSSQPSLICIVTIHSTTLSMRPKSPFP